MWVLLQKLHAFSVVPFSSLLHRQFLSAASFSWTSQSSVRIQEKLLPSQSATDQVLRLRPLSSAFTTSQQAPPSHSGPSFLQPLQTFTAPGSAPGSAPGPTPTNFSSVKLHSSSSQCLVFMINVSKSYRLKSTFLSFLPRNTRAKINIWKHDRTIEKEKCNARITLSGFQIFPLCKLIVHFSLT